MRCFCGQEHLRRDCPRVTRIFVCGDSHVDVFKRVGNLAGNTVDVVLNRLPAISAQGLGNPESKLQAAKRFRNMIKANQDRISWLVLFVGSVDFDFVMHYKQFGLEKPITVQEQIDASINGISFFLYSIQEWVPADKIILIGLHPPAIHDEHLYTVLTKERPDQRQEQTHAIPTSATALLPSLAERTARVTLMNSQLESFAHAQGHLFIGIAPHLLDSTTGTVSDAYRRQGPLDVHLEEASIAPMYVSAMLELGVLPRTGRKRTDRSE